MSYAELSGGVNAWGLGKMGARGGFGSFGGSGGAQQVPYPAPPGYVWEPLTIDPGSGAQQVTMTVNNVTHNVFMLRAA